MYYSLFEIFALGIGPSSSHTVGPMRAAKRYVENLLSQKKYKDVKNVKVTLYGSLALTGEGHGTLKAIVFGLMGLDAATMDLEYDYIAACKKSKKLCLGGKHNIGFDYDKDLILEKKVFLPQHSNGMKFSAYDKNGKIILEETYFSVGGGTIARSDEMERRIERKPYKVPYQFDSCQQLIDVCRNQKLTISELVLKNEKSLYPEMSVHKEILNLAQIMQNTIDRGILKDGILPGGLNLKRRAPVMYADLASRFVENDVDALTIVDWINLWAIAVAEENASGGRIVTAPTMGSAGVLPSVMRYYQRFAIRRSPYTVEKANVVFLTTASAICSLYRSNASISGAEVGCQGEIGVACSMAAGALVAVLGGTLQQIENAAEIAMEHNLGLTCDPIKGLVQAPCIERNAMGAVKAVNAARLALRNTNSFHLVSLDSIIKTMYETGLSLSSRYKETSLAGLAKNVKC
ncbi:MAG: L-serine ammonia-lyase [Alphaproteobacteria bacterium]|nr:L-serine ammonia-lyase [Alphaproteobacteria bacterium]